MVSKKELILIVFLFPILILLISSVSALFPCDWNTKGGDLLNAPNYQYYPQCTSQFGITNVSIVSYPLGQTTSRPVEPLVAGVTANTNPYIVFQAGNYLETFDKNLNQISETNVGEAVGQFDLITLAGNNSIYNGLAGIYRTNMTSLQFRLYKYDNLSNIYYLNASQNLNLVAGTQIGSNGVRCIGSTLNQLHCYVLTYNITSGSNQTNIFYDINGYGSIVSTFPVGVTMNNVTHPLSMGDWNTDGTNDFVYFSSDMVRIFDGTNGNPLLNYTFHRPQATDIVSAKFYYATPSASGIRLAIFDDCIYGSGTACSGSIYTMATITSIKNDGTVSFSATDGFNGNSVQEVFSSGFGIADYNGDGKDDLWFSSDLKRAGNFSIGKLNIVQGDTGTVLYNSTFNSELTLDESNLYPYNSQIVRLDNDTTPDFMMSNGTRLDVISPFKNTMLYNSTLISGSSISTCVPADVDYDGLQEIICSGTLNTTIFQPNYVNQNAVIDSVSYSPSLTVAPSTTVIATVNASDVEDDLLYYSIKCSDSDSQSSENNNPAQSCTYLSEGLFNLTVFVRDLFHAGQYNSFSQFVNVSVLNVGSCNNNGTCDAGENYFNCPNDCTTPPSNVTSTEGNQVVTMPNQLVDTSQNYAVGHEQGLLPEIYYGILGFLGNNLSPIVIILFAFFTVLILLAIASFIIAIARKIGK